MRHTWEQKEIVLIIVSDFFLFFFGLSLHKLILLKALFMTAMN